METAQSCTADDQSEKKDCLQVEKQTSRQEVTPGKMTRVCPLNPSVPEQPIPRLIKKTTTREQERTSINVGNHSVEIDVSVVVVRKQTDERRVDPATGRHRVKPANHNVKLLIEPVVLMSKKHAKTNFSNSTTTKSKQTKPTTLTLPACPASCPGRDEPALRPLVC